MRALAFTELADDPVIVKRLRELYDTLDAATTPATVLLPWLPGPSTVRKILATKRIYDIIAKALDDRMKNGVARDDTPQMLIDAGDERLIIIGVSGSFLRSLAASLSRSRPSLHTLRRLHATRVRACAERGRETRVGVGERRESGLGLSLAAY